MGRWARWWWRSQPFQTDWALICPGVVERSLSILPTDSLLRFWLEGFNRPARGELADCPADWLAPGWMTMDRVFGAGLMGSGHTFGR